MVRTILEMDITKLKHLGVDEVFGVKTNIGRLTSLLTEVSKIKT